MDKVEYGCCQRPAGPASNNSQSRRFKHCQTGLLAQRRPFLAFLLAVGAPAVSIIRTFDYRDPLQVVCTSSDSNHLLPALHPRRTWCFATILVQYLLAVSAVVNVAHTSWQLCVQTLCSFSTETTFHRLLWTFSALIIHILGAIAVNRRIRIAELSADPPVTFLRKARRRVSEEFRLSVVWAKGKSHVQTTVVHFYLYFLVYLHRHYSASYLWHPYLFEHCVYKHTRCTGRRCSLLGFHYNQQGYSHV